MIRPAETQPDLRAQAADRIVRAEMAGLAPQDDASLVAWRRTSRDHEEAFAEAVGAWEAASGLKTHPRYSDLLGPPTLREQWVAWRERSRRNGPMILQPRRLALGALCAGALVTFLLMGTERRGASEYRTQIAQIKDVALEDGSRVTLGGRSGLSVDYEPDVRRVTLAPGEAFFSVASNRDRPFIVEAGNTSIRVVGTKFNVKFDGSRVRVAVLEGIVEVRRADGMVEKLVGGSEREAVRIIAGQQAVDAPSLAGPRLEAVSANDPGAWRGGRLSYQDASLGEIIADANRYREKEIRIAAPSLIQERLTTSFKTTQIDLLLDQLTDTLPVRVERNPDGTVDLKTM